MANKSRPQSELVVVQSMHPLLDKFAALDEQEPLILARLSQTRRATFSKRVGAVLSARLIEGRSGWDTPRIEEFTTTLRGVLSLATKSKGGEHTMRIRAQHRASYYVGALYLQQLRMDADLLQVKMWAEIADPNIGIFAKQDLLELNGEQLAAAVPGRDGFYELDVDSRKELVSGSKVVAVVCDALGLEQPPAAQQ